MRQRAFLWLLLAAAPLHASGLDALDAERKPRLLILTDIGGDPDDQQSLVRLLLYANELEIEGLIASASGTRGELREKVTNPHLIHAIVEAYGRVRERLAVHARGYPEPAVLLDRIRSGNAARGREAVGEGHDSEGSRWIIEVAERPDPRPLDIAIWGGQTDLAQALWRVRRDRGPDALAAFIGKLRVHDVADQDGIAAWILEEFPGLFWVLDKAPRGRDMREAAFRGMYLGGDISLTSREWIDEHVRRGHGPLGALYPPRTWTAPNPHSALKEGDTPSWFYFLPHGLNDPAHPERGGYGGRFERRSGRFYRDAEDSAGGAASARATVWRWRPAFQADFQARLDWCVAEHFEDANHAPRAVLQGDRSRRVLEIDATPGESVRLSAGGSDDPDGGALTFRWWIYPEPSTYRGELALSTKEGEETRFTAPEVEEPRTVHVVLEVRDGGTPPLTSYRRAVVRVVPVSR